MNEIKLHLGCGSIRLTGFINVDIRDLPGVDKVEDVISLPSFIEKSVDLIYACHVLEPLSRHDRLSGMNRWFEVLRSGGILRLAVPDFEKIVHLYTNKGVGVDQLIGFLYGGQDYEFNFHYYCWDFKSLKSDLENVGFSNVRKYEWRETDHANIDDYSQSYWPHMQKDNGVLMSLNVEASKYV